MKLSLLPLFTLVTVSAARKLQVAGPNVTVSSSSDFVVVFSSTVASADAKVAKLLSRHPKLFENVPVTHTYNALFKGMAIHDATPAVLQLLEDDAQVTSIQPNVLGTMSAQGSIRTTPSSSSSAAAAAVDWGLDRIDQVALPLDDKYNYVNTGFGVKVFVLDSGLRTTHAEFGTASRATCGFDATMVNTKNKKQTKKPCADTLGHGTSVAAMVGGQVSGAAKNVKLIGVKVARGMDNVDLAEVLIGLDYVMQQRKVYTKQPMVVVMALNFPRVVNDNVEPVDMLETAVAGLIAANVTVIASAGNMNGDACRYVPNMVPGVITVGATNKKDQIASFSNTGACVDVYAPGSNVRTAMATNNTAMGAVSGTSFAAPLVAGVVARMLKNNRDWTPFEVAAAIRANATMAAKLKGNSSNEVFPLLHYVEEGPPCPYNNEVAWILCSKKKKVV